MASILRELAGFRPGTRARATLWLRTGYADVTANSQIQAQLDRWVQRIEKYGAGAREKVLRAFENAGAT